MPIWLSGAAIAWVAAGFWRPPPAAKPATPQPSIARRETAAPAATMASADTPAVAPPADDYPITALPLALLATQLEEVESRSRAVIVDLVDLDTATLHVGEAFANHPEASLARIEEKRVLIDHAGRLEQLAVGGNPQRLLARLSLDLRQAKSPPGAEALAFRRRSAERLRERIDHPPEPSGVAGGLLVDGTPTPVYRSDELVGFEIDAVRPGGVYDRIGLRNGDRIDAINGVALGGAGASEAVIGALGSAPHFEIAVERRDGRRETLSIPTEQLLRELTGLGAAR